VQAVPELLDPAFGKTPENEGKTLCGKPAVIGGGAVLLVSDIKMFCPHKSALRATFPLLMRMVHTFLRI
jgi:hypothetical protein